MAARALAVICALNVNGVVTMTLDVGQTASIPILICSLILIAKSGHRAKSAPFLLLCAAIVSYLFFAYMFFDPIEAVHPPEKFWLTYGASLLLLWSVCGYVASLALGPQLRSFLVFVRNCFLVSAASVWASPIVYPFFVNLPPSAFNRMGGFFGNPNEAAVASLLAVALVLALPFRRLLLQVVAVVVGAGATVLTFSKSGIAVLVLLFGWHAFRSAKGGARLAVVFATAILVLVIQDLDAILTSIAESPLLELDSSQRGRLLSVVDILSGRIDKDTTTGRTELWALALSKAWNNFPFGGGLGTAHNLVGGIIEDDAWQGAHNTIIMLLGEAGPLPALLAIAALVRLGHYALFHAMGDLERYTFLVLLIELMATHGALGNRYSNLMLGIVFGLLPRPHRERAPRSSPSARYLHAPLPSQNLGPRPQ